MGGALDLLERRVAAATDLIAGLRSKVARLEHELASAVPCPDATPSPSPDPAPLAELERLRAERAMVRERIRGLLTEFDKVTW